MSTSYINFGYTKRLVDHQPICPYSGNFFNWYATFAPASYIRKNLSIQAMSSAGKKIPDFPAFGRISQFSQCCCLNLPDPLPGNIKPFPHLLQGQGMACLKTEPEDNDLPFPGVQPLEHGIDLFRGYIFK